MRMKCLALPGSRSASVGSKQGSAGLLVPTRVSASCNGLSNFCLDPSACVYLMLVN